MFRASLLTLVTALAVLSGGLVGQDPKKDDKKPDDKKAVESKSAETKSVEPAAKLKGVLPPNWKKLGLTDDQVQKIYKVQNKYDDEIDKLQAQITKLKAERTKDMQSVLTTDQKKRLDDILTGKDK